MRDNNLNDDVRAILIAVLLIGCTIAAAALAAIDAQQAEQDRLDSMSPPILPDDGGIHG